MLLLITKKKIAYALSDEKKIIDIG